MKKVLSFLAAITMLTGCAALHVRAELQSELQNAADCFFDAVSILQEAPCEGDSLAVFLMKAMAKQATGVRGDFSILRWDESGQYPLLSDGRKVFWRIKGESHDDFTDGRSATHVTYEFYTVTAVPPATTTISLWF